MRSGQGTLTLPNGDKYVGAYKDDKRNGHGTYTWSNGQKYVGWYKDDNRNGQGAYTYSTGDKYVGEYKDDQPNGHGIYTWSDGSKYVGEYKDAKRNGQGVLYAADGSVVRAGMWLNDAFVEPAAALPHVSVPSGRDEVSLTVKAGTFKVPVVVNGVLELQFTVDSGATDVSIPADVVMTLMHTGTLRPDDFLGTQTYVLADGTKVPSKTFRIRSLKVGDKIVENVIGNMAKPEGSLLLGQGFLSRFGRVSFDYTRKVLILE